MRKFFFQLKSNSANRIGERHSETVWTDKCQTKKEVRERYSSKTSSGNTVIAIYTEEQFIEKFGVGKAASTKRYWNA